MRRPSSQPTWHKGPVKVRREEPAIEEAIAAAMDLSEDADEIASIAAGLMGVPEDDIRPHLAKTMRQKQSAGGPIRRDGSPVVVVSRTRRVMPGQPAVAPSVLRQGLLPRSR